MNAVAKAARLAELEAIEEGAWEVWGETNDNPALETLAKLVERLAMVIRADLEEAHPPVCTRLCDVRNGGSCTCAATPRA